MYPDAHSHRPHTHTHTHTHSRTPRTHSRELQGPSTRQHTQSTYHRETAQRGDLSRSFSHSPTNTSHTATHGWWRSFIGSSMRQRAGSIRCPSPESRVTKDGIIAERCGPTAAAATTTTTILAAALSRKARGRPGSQSARARRSECLPLQSAMTRALRASAAHRRHPAAAWSMQCACMYA